jgi:hypothetical protein
VSISPLTSNLSSLEDKDFGVVEPIQALKYLYLDWTQRPDSVKAAIAGAFTKIVKRIRSTWGVFNGNDTYALCEVNEQPLLKKIIQQAPADQKEFYALDIGAGDFQWSKSMADYIEKQADLPLDIKVHIIGIRGESYLGDRVVETNRCKIYNLGAFKVEELFEQFKKEGLDLENKIDLAVSQWCFRHLVDPVGTAVQVYNLLRPKAGYFLVDGFFFSLDQGKMKYELGNTRMTQLFLDMKAPFLTQHHEALRSLNRFIMRRPDGTPCQLSMAYSGMEGLNEENEMRYIFSGYITQFERKVQTDGPEDFHLPSRLPEDGIHHYLYGDKEMYDWLKKQGLLIWPTALWRSIRDQEFPTPILHRAIMKGQRKVFDACFQPPEEDIDMSDSEGQVALHIAIQKKSYELFQLLLERGARTELYNGRGNTPLHEAAIIDNEGRFLQSLLDAGAQVNAKYYKYGPSPLDRAIEAKNPNAVKILIQAKAEISEKNVENLKDPIFSSDSSLT